MPRTTNIIAEIKTEGPVRSFVPLAKSLTALNTSTASRMRCFSSTEIFESVVSSDSLTSACFDTFATYTRIRVSSSAGALGISGAQTVADCQSSCMSDASCTGLTWIGNTSVIPSGGQQCTIYRQPITSTASSDKLTSTYIRQTCQTLPTSTTGKTSKMLIF